MTVIVIGGGAAGLMAALTAAEDGHTVIIAERQSRVGRKLMATGNGRCNLTNANMGPEFYHSGSPSFPDPALRQFGTEETLQFFHRLGLLTVTEPSGRIYPLSDQAGSVVDVLRFAAEHLRIQIVSGYEVSSITKKGGVFSITGTGEPLTGDRVIICCGGAAGEKLGGGRSGYQLLQSMGHHCTELYPALVQLKTDPAYVRSLKGVRADAEIRLQSGKQILAASAGEIQFTETGVSGPAAFEISRCASTHREAMSIHLDLLRDYTVYQAEKLVAARMELFPELTLENLLTGILQNRLGRTILRYAGFELNTPASALRPRDSKKIGAAIKDFHMEYRGTNGFDSAQVTAGGIRCAEFNPQTLESRLVPGLYAAGEVLDVDGDCGGYNLQWAWASGHLAGRLL